MTRPANISRAIISGTYPGGETFAWGFWLSGRAGTQASNDAAAAGVVAAFDANFKATAKDLLATDCAYTQLDLYAYGNTPGDPAIYHSVVPISSGTGTGAGAGLPLQCCLTWTLLTGIASRRTRGRMYLPAVTGNLTGHQFTSGQVGPMNAAMKAFVNAVNAHPDVLGDWAVVSTVGGSYAPVTSISVDTRLDIQRRRAASQAIIAKSTLSIP